MTQLANGACLVHYGDTTVHVAVTASPKPREGVDFFPLSVDYEEKMYAVGKIPGSYLKREGRPSEKAILTSRVIDRPIRPLFDKSMRNDVSIVCTVMSVDPDCQPEIVAMIGASIAISISDVPWNGPISGCSVGMIDGEFIRNLLREPTDVPRLLGRMLGKKLATIASVLQGTRPGDDDRNLRLRRKKRRRGRRGASRQGSPMTSSTSCATRSGSAAGRSILLITGVTSKSCSMAR